jgi:two-component system, OmpR family, response regulator
VRQVATAKPPRYGYGERGLTSACAAADTRGMGPRTRLVLLVEDEPGIRQPLEQFLQMRGYAVVCADAVQAALDLLRLHPPDAAIVDLCLKEGSGRDVIVKIPPRVPVIIFSGMRAESSELERLRPRTRIVEKPYSLTMLLEQLDEMLTPSDHLQANSRF